MAQDLIKDRARALQVYFTQTMKEQSHLEQIDTTFELELNPVSYVASRHDVFTSSNEARRQGTIPQSHERGDRGAHKARTLDSNRQG